MGICRGGLCKRGEEGGGRKEEGRRELHLKSNNPSLKRWGIKNTMKIPPTKHNNLTEPIV